MQIDVPGNRDVLAFLSRRRDAAPLVAASDSAVDPYMHLGSHPEVVERVWDQLGAPLPKGARQIVHGTPCLVHPSTGIILALSLGTAYALRVAENLRIEAQQAGLATTMRWSEGSTTDLNTEIGRGWYFGRWSEREVNWIRSSHG